MGFDQYGNEIPGLAFLWEATGGDIDQAGVFTAGQSGSSDVTASATFGDSVGTGSAEVITGKYGGTFRAATESDTTTLDPALASSVSDQVHTQLVYENLVLRMPDLSLRPMLATSWEPNDDLTSYTFHLREGVKFHNGSGFTAADVVYSLKRVQNPATGSPGASSLDFITDIVALDDYTVRFDLDAPNAFLPDTLSISNAKIVPSNVFPARFATKTFGTGPFRLTQFLSGVRAIFVRNDDYWMEDRPYLDEVIVFYMDKETTQVAALKSGQVDALFVFLPSRVDSLEADPDMVVSEVASRSYLNLAMDSRVEPFDDIRVRKALQLLTDREAIRQTALFGRGLIGNDHPILPNSPYYDQTQTVTPYDKEAAKALLTEAGYPDGLEIDLYTSATGMGMVEMAEAFKESAVAGGVKVNVILVPRDKFWGEVWLQEAFFCAWWTGRNADLAFSLVYKSDAPWNESRIQTPTLDALIVKGRGQANLEGREATYAEIQRIVREDAGRIVPVFRPIFMGMRSNVRGLEAHPQSWPLLHDVWLDE